MNRRSFLTAITAGVGLAALGVKLTPAKAEPLPVTANRPRTLLWYIGYTPEEVSHLRADTSRAELVVVSDHPSPGNELYGCIVKNREARNGVVPFSYLRQRAREIGGTWTATMKGFCFIYTQIDASAKHSIRAQRWVDSTAPRVST